MQQLFVAARSISQTPWIENSRPWPCHSESWASEVSTVTRCNEPHSYHFDPFCTCVHLCSIVFHFCIPFCAKDLHSPLGSIGPGTELAQLAQLAQLVRLTQPVVSDEYR